MAEIELRCRCGSVRGVARDVTPSTGNHIVCYCDDCRAFLRFLEREDLMDAHGGTEIFQMTPAQIRITAGQEQIRCMRLSDEGMVRFYTACCCTPAGNTVSAGLPFVGVPVGLMEPGLAKDGRPRDAILGERVGIQRKLAVSGPPPKARTKLPQDLVFALRLLPLLLRGAIRRAQQPSPYFDPKTAAPRVPPSILSAAQRQALRAKET